MSDLENKPFMIDEDEDSIDDLDDIDFDIGDEDYYDEDEENNVRNSIDLDWSRAMADLIELGFTDAVDDGVNSKKR